MIDMIDKDVVRQILDGIQHDLRSFVPEYSSLLNGMGSTMLFNCMYSNHTGSEYHDLPSDLNTLIDLSAHNKSPSFCDGKAGLHWLIDFLNAKFGMLDATDTEAICCDANELSNYCIFDIERGNYDFLHGATGIARSLVFPQKQQKANLLQNVLISINTQMGNTSEEMISAFSLTTYMPEVNLVNLGLAHGIIAILKFCAECLNLSVASDLAERMIYKIFSYLVSNQNQVRGKFYWGYEIENGNFNDKNIGRLAWCYGDLSIGLILLQCGALLKDNKIINLANEVLLNVAKLRINDDALIKDASLCHGTAGIAHIFYKAHCINPLSEYHNAYTYWIGQTLLLSSFPDGIGGYKTYTNTAGYQKNSGVLEGAAGIGLVLLTALTGDCSWDSCLMLQDVTRQ